MQEPTPQIQLVVLDWAGTIIDFGSRAPALAFQRVFEGRGVAVTDAEARKPMGLNKREHLLAMLSESAIAKRWEAVRGAAWSEADVDAMYGEFMSYQMEAIEASSELVPGVLEVVEQLRAREIKIGTSTGYFQAAVERVVQAAAVAGFQPDAVVGADDVRGGRPAPWMIYRLMEQLDVYPSERVLKLGDTVADIQAGLNASCWSAGVCDSSSLLGLTHEGFQALPEEDRQTRMAAAAETFRLSGCHATLDTLGGLPALVDQFNSRLQAGEVPAHR